ncbi:MAG: ComF family protein [Kiritimatiellae bacterium]|nr:ComF family protein [Kiritimatiellia bacterium]
MRLPDFGAKVMGLAADALFPRLCPGCGNHCDRPGRYLCWSCFSGIDLFTDSLCDCCGRLATGEVGHRFVCSACRHIKPSFDRARSAGHFTGLLQHLLHQFKYSSALWLRNDLTDLLEGCLRAHFDAEQIDAVLPVPLHRLRKRQRTYNQSDLLSAELAKRLNRRNDPQSLSRIRTTGTQTRLNAIQRRENMKGAFKVTNPPMVAGRTLLLVDDVMTTGATLDACAAALKKAGAARVWCITVARGI